jgi:uncharacterized membrane protein (UPF0127 family)
MRLVRANGGDILAADVREARTIRDRMQGLMGKRTMPGDGLLIEPADSIHTFFMRMPIDLIFLAAEGTILKLCPGVHPWRIRLAPRGAASVLEMSAGFIRRTRLAPGDALAFSRAPR